MEGKRAGLLRMITLSERKMLDTDVQSSEGAVFYKRGRKSFRDRIPISCVLLSHIGRQEFSSSLSVRLGLCD